MAGKYSLPDLPYNYGDLAPHISEEQLKIHHGIHHAGCNVESVTYEKGDIV